MKMKRYKCRWKGWKSDARFSPGCHGPAKYDSAVYRLYRDKQGKLRRKKEPGHSCELHYLEHHFGIVALKCPKCHDKIQEETDSRMDETDKFTYIPLDDMYYASRFGWHTGHRAFTVRCWHCGFVFWRTKWNPTVDKTAGVYQNDENPWKQLKSVLKAAFPEWKESERTTIDNVEYRVISSSSMGGWHSGPLSGVQLTVHNFTYHGRMPMRRVMAKNGTIDLDEIREKHTKLAALAKQEKEVHEKIRVERERRSLAVQDLLRELKLPRFAFSLSSGELGVFDMKLDDLSADDVREVIRLLRSRNVESVKECKERDEADRMEQEARAEREAEKKEDAAREQEAERGTDSSI